MYVCYTVFLNSLGSWTFSKAEIELELFNNGFNTNMYLDECPFVVSHGSAVIVDKYYSCCTESYPRLEVSFDIEPRPTVEHNDAAAPVGRRGDKRRVRTYVRKDVQSAKCAWPRKCS